MKKYKLFVQKMYERSVGFYETYGISVFSGGEITRIIRDISVEKEKVKTLVDHFNEVQPDSAHLDQIIEEFLYDFKV